MAEFLLGYATYAYELEYTPEELVARSKAAASVFTEAILLVRTGVSARAVVQCRHHRNVCAATPLN